MAGNKLKKPILTVMPDFGMGPYLWLRDKAKVGVGKCVADEVWVDAQVPCIASIPKELREDFNDWTHQFEAYSDYKRFNWKVFNERGMKLARRLKKVVGDVVVVKYVGGYTEPNCAKGVVVH